MLKYYLLPLTIVICCGCGQNKKNGTANDTAHIAKITDAASQKPVPAAQLIVPGESIGGISINGTADSVYKKLGKPDAGDAATGKSLSTWFAGHDTSGYQTQIFFTRQMGTADDTSRVKQVRITSPIFKMMDYTGVGTSLQTITSAAEFSLKKVGEYTQGSQSFFIYDDAKAGIAFEFNTKNICSGIIVHEPGKSVMDAYMAFHVNAKMVDGK
jgi:hypothetical protein